MQYVDHRGYPGYNHGKLIIMLSINMIRVLVVLELVIVLLILI